MSLRLHGMGVIDTFADSISFDDLDAHFGEGLLMVGEQEAGLNGYDLKRAESPGYEAVVELYSLVQVDGTCST